MNRLPAAPDWIPFDDALRVVTDACAPLPTVTVPIEDALGRALASDIHARVDHPPWDNSAMDGYAVRAQDVAGASEESPVVLPLSGDVPAGAFPAGPLRPGSAVRVMTGAPVPEGATGVIRVEHTTDAGDGRVAFHGAGDARRNIRRAGEDVRRGEIVLRAGDPVTPAAIGVLAMNALRRVEVGRRPRVAVLATGDELAEFDDAGAVLAGRKLMDSNSWAVAARIGAAGAETVRLGVARDDPGLVREMLERALGPVGDATAAETHLPSARRAEGRGHGAGARGTAGCDVLITTAGVSVGEHDHVKSALEALGAERLFWRVRIRPGSPMTFGLLPGRRPVFGLPGNPVSALVTFEALVAPALRTMAGHRALVRRRWPVRVADDVESTAGLTHFFRVRLDVPRGGAAATPEAASAPGSGPSDDLPLATLTGPQGSGILTSMAAADALLIVPEGVERLSAGSVAEAIPLTEWRA